jgi:hypothetical protein
MKFFPQLSVSNFEYCKAKNSVPTGQVVLEEKLIVRPDVHWEKWEKRHIIWMDHSSFCEWNTRSVSYQILKKINLKFRVFKAKKYLPYCSTKFAYIPQKPL